MTPEQKKEFNKKNIEKQKQKLASMTPEELQAHKDKQKQKRLDKLAAMTPEELEAYKEKQRQYKLNYKLRKQQIIDDTLQHIEKNIENINLDETMKDTDNSLDNNQ